MWFGKLSILLYFSAVSIATAYAVCTLWMAAPKEAPSQSATAPPDCSNVAGTAPKITRLEPETVAMGENYAGVTIVGCNFSDKAKVRFNGVERISQPVSADQLNVPLVASDFAGAANIAVSVEVQTTLKDKDADKDGKNEPAQVARSNVMNLRIKPPADVKVVWVFVAKERPITVELRLILLVLLVGALSACVFGLNSFANYAGAEKLQANWLWFYFARPVIGAGVAFVFYLVIRGGFLAGTNADAKAINPFGFVAVAALVGMFCDAALNKLNDVFDTLFRAPDSRKQGLDAMIIETNDLPDGKVGQAYPRQELKAKDGTPPYLWLATGLPAALNLSPAGVLDGTPNTAVTQQKVIIQVTDAEGKIAKKELKLTIAS